MIESCEVHFFDIEGLTASNQVVYRCRHCGAAHETHESVENHPDAAEYTILPGSSGFRLG